MPRAADIKKAEAAARTPKKVAEAQAAERVDAIDRLAGVPSANSRRGGSRHRMTEAAIDELYASSGTAARIVDVLAEEATRAGFTIVTDEDFDHVEFRSWWEGLDASSIITQAIKYSRQYGGGLVQIISRTESDERLPLRDSEEIDSLRAVACIEVAPEDSTRFDPKALGMPEVWNVSPMYGGTDVPVHNSRMLPIQGRSQPVSWRRGSSGCYRYFGMSVFQGITEEILDYDDCHAWASLLLKRLQQGVWYGDGIADACETKAGERSVERRLALVDGTRSARATIAVDKANEDYKLLNGSLAGVKDVISEKKARLSMVTGVPAMILAGDTSGGLNNSAEGALSSWDDTICRFQTFQLTPLVQRLVQIKYPNLKDYEVRWNDLTQETPGKRADRIYKESQADNTYVGAYILSADEVRDTLAKRGDYVLGAKTPVPPQVVTVADANPTDPNAPPANGDA